MTRVEVLVLPEAEAEISAALHWYRARNPQAADSFRHEVFEAIDALATSAFQWKADEDGFRRRLLRHFPYTLWYQIEGETATVLAVAHHRQAPGYWRFR